MEKYSFIFSLVIVHVFHQLDGMGNCNVGAVFKPCEGLESYGLASFSVALFLLADSQPTSYFC